jgi:hypothetical protein
MIINGEEKLLMKARLKLFCEQVIEKRIAFTRQAMDNAQSAANGEEKSSAGDKYETSRAMSHLEKDMHARQLLAHLEELSAIRRVNVNMIYDAASAGAFIQCKKISFFIGAGLGRQLIDNVPVIFLSPQSPLAKSIADKKAGDHVIFNGEVLILDIF